MSRAPAMNKKQLQAAIYEPRCHFCRWKKDHPEVAGLVEYRLLNKRDRVESMIELIAKDYGVRLSPKQVNHHMTHHLPDQTLIVRQALKHGLDVDSVDDIPRQNLLVLQVIKELGLQALSNGEMDVDMKALLKCIEIQCKMTEGDKVVINPPSQFPPFPPLMDAELLNKFVDVFYDFVPINRRREFRDVLDREVRPLAMEKARKQFEAQLSKGDDAGESTDSDEPGVGVFCDYSGTPW